ncbi:MAG TPA: recombinase family protein [Solirubrobacteraceae bacterium]|nr:recombinase family protein [Solirubrobacteraceae bacterium]
MARGSGLPNQARSLLEVFTDLRRAGVTLRSVADDAFVTNQMLVGVASEMAHKYSADLAAHVKRGMQAQFDRGERLGGPVPEGYLLKAGIENERATREYVIDGERAPIIRRAVELALDGLGSGAIARRLNQEGHRLKSGKLWNRRRVHYMLSNPFYAGRVAMFRGTDREQVQVGTWPPLIDPDVFDRIRRMMAARGDKRAGVGRPTTRYALAKLATCGRCGARMYAMTSPYKRKDGSHQRSYVCANANESADLCDQPKLDAAKIDASVVDHLNRLFVDFEAWMAALASSMGKQRARMEAGCGRLLDEVTKIQRREAKLRARYIDVLDAPAETAAFEAYQHVLKEREAVQEQLRALQEAVGGRTGSTAG